MQDVVISLGPLYCRGIVAFRHPQRRSYIDYSDPKSSRIPSMSEESVEGCFYCDAPAIADATVEVSVLGEPMSEVESNFILERCLITDRERWIQEFRSISKSSKGSQAIPLSIPYSLEQKTPTNASTTSVEEVRAVENSSQRLQRCHICGLIQSNIY
jgi:hypothetical protein